MIMDTKEKEKKIRLRFYNIVIHPADKHKPEFYILLFDKIRDLGTAYATATDKKTKLRSYAKSNDLIQCTLINYTQLDANDDWYNEQTDELFHHNVDPNIYPHAKEWDIYFYPNNHRMAVVAKKGISWSQIVTFFTKAFDDVCYSLGFDEVKITQETSQEGLDEIFNFDSIDSIEIEVSYSNNDTNDITAMAIDSQFKQNNVSCIKTKAEGSKGRPLTLKNDDTYLASLVKLSKHNGFAKAQGKVGRHVKKVNTKNYPMVQTLKKVTSKNIFQKVFNLISTLF